ncbi:MAG TPA: glycerol kinase GlpK [Candidatus Ventricola gallistercoris]|nr:glycerol kinase GlpK [Candidatus Ventricola gallistercoris]
MHSYVIALDQGTTSSRAVVFDENANIVAMKSYEFEQIYPKPGWVEHDPAAILNTQVDALREAVRISGVPVEQIAAIGITNQRETTILWDRKTGRPLHNAIVWQCRRTAPIITRLCEEGLEGHIREVTGLVPDAYFSGSKICWLLDTLGLHERAARGEICFGTVDSYLAWHLITGHPHVTDATNASRTMLFDIRSNDWDDTLLSALRIPRAMLPQVVDTSEVIGMLDPSILGRAIPVAALCGDQHSALFGQGCFEPGMMKNTYGTGCFLLMNTGGTPAHSSSGLVTTIAWRIGGTCTYALEGSVFVGGAAVQWLRDEMKLIERASETETIARSLKDNGGVYMVPTFTGLGAPYWDMYSRGTIIGLTRGTGRAHIVRAALESIAYQSADLVQAMAEDCGQKPLELRVDGGASANQFLMQFQSDVLGCRVIRPAVIETTALGAALLAGLATGVWKDMDEIRRVWQMDMSFSPQMSEQQRTLVLRGWHRAVRRSMRWASDEGQD